MGRQIEWVECDGWLQCGHGVEFHVPAVPRAVAFMPGYLERKGPNEKIPVSILVTPPLDYRGRIEWNSVLKDVRNAIVSYVAAGGRTERLDRVTTRVNG